MPTIPYVRATHSDGQPWNAAKANVLEAGVNDVSYAPCVRVTHNAAQSITSATWTSLAFNTETFDQAGNAADTMHDNVTNNNRLTCRYAGVYAIWADVEFAANSTGVRYIRMRNQAAAVIASQQLNFTPGGADTTQLHLETMWAMAVNDWVEVQVWQTSGAGLNVNSAASYSPVFGMCRVG